ncbi:RHS repeat-associated core domain-containing protein [Flavobacterium cupreum]|uniref:RHS repeat-associated core domain-containing protein n=1 Tax=Flavobacterium cupreum TaxID=2133766 RepID=A0A434A568_9FLAO|nr:RHS repeat-associated core domain-containing protein [Flavobacterium cupreum]
MRLSYSDKDNNGIVNNTEIIEESNYYPFGFAHKGYNSLVNSSNPGQKYRYNGKELQDDNIGGSQLNWYDFGARNYDPALGRWVNIDPLAEDEPEWSTYRYGYNNPLRFIDPTGMLETDYLDVSTGELTQINDGKDQVIAATTSEINKAKENFTNNKNQYNKDLSKKEGSSSNLNLSRSQFIFLAETLYAESSGSFGETLGIVNVLENRANNQGNSFMDQLSADTPYGVYGVWKTSGGKNSTYKYAYQNESGAGVENKKLNIHKAIATGLMTSLDITKGAYFWDGTDITTNSHYLNWGLKFSNPGHNLWNLKETSGTNQLITTRAIDKTTFSKFQNQGKKWSSSN